MRTVISLRIFQLTFLAIIAVSITNCVKEQPLTTEEREWLSEHGGNIRVAPESQYPPFTYADEEGIWRGLSADYIKLVEQKLNVSFKVVQPDNLATNLEKAKQGAVDVLTSVKKTPQRSEFLLFTKPYVEVPTVIIVRQEVKGSLSPDKMKGMKIAVGEGYGVQSWLEDNYGYLDLAPLPDDLVGLRKVSFNEVDAIVMDVASASYFIQSEGIGNLRIAGNVGYTYDLSMASRRDWPILNRIIEKGLAQISVKERQAIYKEWIQLEQDLLLATKEFWIAILVSFGVGVLIIVGVMTWNRSLKRQIGQRTEQLRKELAERKQAEDALQKAHDELEERVAARTRQLEVQTVELTRAKEAAEAADRLKSAFLATMSHELRTPLNSIIGFTGIVLQGLAGPLNDEQIKQLSMVRDSGRHLLNLINDVLDISKIEAGQIEIVSEPFDMREAITKVVQTVAPLAEKKNLRLSAEVSPEVGRITSDRRRVEQILINLVNNAIKFTDKGEVLVECQVSNDQVGTCVKDTGIGIKLEDMDKLFKAFQQIDTGMARQYEGTGLGLSICKKLAEMLGGEIRAESKLGAGSVFTFMLPVKMGEEDETQNPWH